MGFLSIRKNFGPPFWYFLKINFWPTDPKCFLKAPLVPIYTNFEGGSAPKKRDFFVKIFQKVPKNGFFDLFFQKVACGPKKLAKTASFYCFTRARKINLVELLEKKVVIFFQNPYPPREIPRS